MDIEFYLVSVISSLFAETDRLKSFERSTREIELIRELGLTPRKTMEGAGDFAVKAVGAKCGDRVAVLLCTCGGARFLRSQLQSIAAQSHENWSVYASDDASQDATWEILAEFRSRLHPGRVEMRRGPGRGFVANFLRLACADIEGDYFAFCDQDDIWEPDKLARAVAWLSRVDPHTPALYCSRTRLIDERGHSIGLSPLFSRTPGFGNAIVQCIAGGNTMVFNAAARRLLIKAGDQVSVPSHDWWLYILVTAMGGTVRYDCNPTVRYRVHRSNVVGPNRSFRARIARIHLLLRGQLRVWTDMHVNALSPVLSEISPEGRRILGKFVKVRRGNIFRRIFYTQMRPLYRQTLPGNIALFFALVLGKA